jgi:hypothetical protein
MVELRRARESSRTHCNYRHFPLFNIIRSSFSCMSSVLYGCLCVFLLCCECICVLMYSAGVCLISRVKVLEVSCQEGVTEYCGL